MATKTKKPVKKATAKKPTAKKKTANAKKPTAKKATPKKTSASKTTRRPDPSPQFPIETIEATADHLNLIKVKLEEYAAHMRPLDRARHNGVGIRRQGFIERAYMLAVENQEFLPHWLPMTKFRDDNDHFLALRSAFDIANQVQELIWNLVVLSADMVFTDALEFYAQVRDAADRRVDAAESINNELKAFFARTRTKKDEPTEEEILRDMKALLKGKRDGKIDVVNINPKAAKGVRKVVDEKFTDSAQFRETKEGEITE